MDKKAKRWFIATRKFLPGLSKSGSGPSVTKDSSAYGEVTLLSSVDQPVGQDALTSLGVESLSSYDMVIIHVDAGSIRFALEYDLIKSLPKGGGVVFVFDPAIHLERRRVERIMFVAGHISAGIIRSDREDIDSVRCLARIYGALLGSGDIHVDHD